MAQTIAVNACAAHLLLLNKLALIMKRGTLEAVKVSPSGTVTTRKIHSFGNCCCTSGSLY